MQDFEKKGVPEMLEKLLKQWIDLKPFEIFKKMSSVFHFSLGIGNSMQMPSYQSCKRDLI